MCTCLTMTGGSVYVSVFWVAQACSNSDVMLFLGMNPNTGAKVEKDGFS